MGGGIKGEIKGEFIGKFPIPPLTPQNKTIAKKIESLVDEILQSKSHNPESDTSALEKEIDKWVYKLYKLTTEEIGIVEEN